MKSHQSTQEKQFNWPQRVVFVLNIFKPQEAQACIFVCQEGVNGIYKDRTGATHRLSIERARHFSLVVAE